MINNRFEIYKIEREIKRSGNKFIFFRYGKNKFGELSKTDFVKVAEIEGLYHEENSTIQTFMTDVNLTRNKKIPKILAIYRNEIKKIGMEDFVNINGKICKVTGVTNIMEWNKICDISLEVVDDGF